MANNEVTFNSINPKYVGLDQTDFDKRYFRKVEENLTLKEKIKRKCACHPTKKKTLSCIDTYLPLVPFVRSYKLKSYLIRDMIAGISVGFMAIPQSLGYARIGNIPELAGLYTSFFPVVIYFLFTTSKHVSLGTLPITSLIVGSAINTLVLPSEMFHKNGTITFDSTNMTESMKKSKLMEMDDELKLLVTVSISCSAGIILILMSFCKLGFIISFMSDSFISGYLASTVARVLVIEYRDMLGLRPKAKHVGVAEFFPNTYEIFRETPNANLVQVAMSIIALIILLVIKEFANERFKKKFKVPIPVEIIVVIIAIIISMCLDMENTYNVEILTGMKSGLPSVVLPDMGYMLKFIVNAVLSGVVSYMLVGMMAKLFATNYGYHVDNDREMFALGLSSLLACFFSSIVPSTSPSRCYLTESTGGKTQASHLFTGALALLTMVVFAPYIRNLPICILASIIVIACVPLYNHFFKSFYYWKTNKYDFAVWFVTFWSTLIFAVEEGMIIGLGFSIIVVHFWMQNETYMSSLKKNNDGLFLDKDLYLKQSSTSPVHAGDTRNVNELPLDQDCYRVFKFESSIFFTTLDRFKDLLFSKVPSPTILKKIKEAEMKKNKKPVNLFSCCKKNADKSQNVKNRNVFKDGNKGDLEVAGGSKNIQLKSFGPADPKLTTIEINDHNLDLKYTLEDINNNENEMKRILSDSDEKEANIANELKLKLIVIDMSSVTILDTGGSEMLAFLHDQYKKYGVNFTLASSAPVIVNQLKRVPVCRDLAENCLYPSVYDAIIVEARKLSKA